MSETHSPEMISELEQEIKELREDLVFVMSEYVDRQTFDLNAECVRSSNADTLWEESSPMDMDEIRFNRILRILAEENNER